MADAADYTTDAGLDALAAHRRGECSDSGPCPYRVWAETLHRDGRCGDGCPVCKEEDAALLGKPTPADLAEALREIANDRVWTKSSLDLLEAAARLMDLAADRDRLPAPPPAPVPPRKRGRQ